MMGEKEFDEYYGKLYGERWPALKEALLEPGRYYELVEGTNGTRLAAPYFLGEASYRAAKSLRHGEGSRILDACAAPGGKTLVLALDLQAGATITANDVSGERRRRLIANLDERLPPELRERITITGRDAATLARRSEMRGTFDAILLDAPCSSEAHVLASPEHLSRWTPARPRQLAMRQWALLSACFLLLKSGGSLSYLTCALATEENDGVTARLCKKYRGQFTLDKPHIADSEKTEHGEILLPDKCGLGPMYICRILKK
jgi:16S rRNA (cytosine1407-C5)-methyltransferase